MDGDVDVVTEIDAGFQVALVHDIAVQVGLRPDTPVRSGFHVAGIVNETGIQLQGLSAGGLIGIDDAQFLIILVQGVLLVIELLVRGALRFVSGILHVPQLPVPEIDAGGPVQMVHDTALDIGQHTQHVPAHAEIIDAGGLVGPILGVGFVQMGQGSAAVESPKAVQGVVHISDRRIDTHVGDQILGVVGEVQAHAVAVREIGGLPADLVKRIRIGTPVSIVVYISEGSCLETVVNGIGGSRKEAEAPACLHFLLFLLCGKGEHRSCGKQGAYGQQ